MTGQRQRARVEVNVIPDEDDPELGLYYGSGHGFVEGWLEEESGRLVLIADNGERLRSLHHPIFLREEDGYVWFAGVAGENLPYGRGGLQTPVDSGEQVAWRVALL